MTRNQEGLVLKKINNELVSFIDQLLRSLKKENCILQYLIRKDDKGIKYLLYAIDLFSKYALVVPLKDKKGSTIVNALQSILDS